MFGKLCGDDALKNIILGTTKWGGVTLRLAKNVNNSFAIHTGRR